MRQVAPEPQPLIDLVSRLTYKPNCRFELRDIDRHQGSEGLTLSIYIAGPDTDDFAQTIRVVHYMIVPAASFNEISWRRWLFEQILLVEQHEASEFFKIDGEKVYAPNHGPGYDPYVVREFTTADEREINFRGERGPNRPKEAA